MNEQQKQCELLERIYRCIPSDHGDKLNKIYDRLMSIDIKYSIFDKIFNQIYWCIVFGFLYQIMITLQEILIKL